MDASTDTDTHCAQEIYAFARIESISEIFHNILMKTGNGEKDMSRTCKFLFALLTLFILIGCQKRQMRSEIRLPMTKAESIQTKTIATVGNITQKEMAWRNLVEQLPDVSDKATFPVSGEAWNPESITLQRGETVYWVDQSEDWNASKICTRISGRTHCLYTAKDGSLPQLAAFEDMLFFTQPDGIYRMSMKESKPELWIPNGGQVTLTGGVIYTWLSELDFFAIAVEKPEEAVCVWRQNADFELRQYVPVTGGMVFWLEEKESEGSVSRVWTVLLVVIVNDQTLECIAHGFPALVILIEYMPSFHVAVFVDHQEHLLEMQTKICALHISRQKLPHRVRQPRRGHIPAMRQERIDLHMHPACARDLNVPGQELERQPFASAISADARHLRFAEDTQMECCSLKEIRGFLQRELQFFAAHFAAVRKRRQRIGFLQSPADDRLDLFHFFCKAFFVHTSRSFLFSKSVGDVVMASYSFCVA